MSWGNEESSVLARYQLRRQPLSKLKKYKKNVPWSSMRKSPSPCPARGVPFWLTGRRPVLWVGAGSGSPWWPAGRGQHLWSPPLLPNNSFTCLTEVFPWLTHQFRCPAHFSVSVLHFPVFPAPKLKPMECKANARTCFQRPGLKPQQWGYLSVFNSAGQRLGSVLGDAGGWHWSQRVVLIFSTRRCSEHLALKWATAGVHSTDLKMACLHPNPALNHAMPFTRILKVG